MEIILKHNGCNLEKLLPLIVIDCAKANDMSVAAVLSDPLFRKELLDALKPYGIEPLPVD